jgi:hypothetical protein
MIKLDVTTFTTTDANWINCLQPYVDGANYYLSPYNMQLNVVPQSGPTSLLLSGPMYDPAPDGDVLSMRRGDLRAAAQTLSPGFSGLPVIFCKFAQSDAAKTTYTEDQSANRYFASRLAPQSIQPPHAVAMSSVSAQSRFDFSKMSSVIFLALGNAASKASRVIIVPSLFRRHPSSSLTHNWNLGGSMFSLASSRASRRFRSESFIGADRVVVALQASEGGARFRWPRLFSRSSRPT